MKKIYLHKTIMVILIMILFACILSAIYFSRMDQNVYLFGVAGPLSGSDEIYGTEMIRGIKLCTEQINANGGINGKRLKFICEDDMNKPNLAMKAANTFSKTNQLLFVIGHYSSAASFSAGQVYLKEGVPAITASAPAINVTSENEWYFRSIPSSRLQASFLAMYSKRHLKATSVNIIASKDVYSRDIKIIYMSLFKNMGIAIDNLFDIDEKQTIYPQLQSIVKTLKSSKTNSPILILTHNNLAVQLIEKLKTIDPQFLLTNGNVFSHESFQNELKTIALENAIPGYYSNGVLTTASDIFANYLFNAPSINFFKLYYARYHSPPSSIATNYYDATLLMADILKRIEIAPDDQSNKTTQYRRQIKNFLADMNKPDYAFKGICGDIFFDDKGNAIKNIGLGQYQNGVLAAYHQQFLLDMKSTFNYSNPYESANQSLSIVQVKTEITELDIKDNAFTAQFFLTFLYHNPKLDPSDITFPNTISPINLGSPVEKGTIDDVLYQKYRVEGTFKTDFVYHRYPFDTQKLFILFYHNTLKSSDMRYIQKEILLSEDRFNLSQWKLKYYYSYGMLTEKEIDYSQTNPEGYPDFRIQIRIDREYYHQVIRCFIPGCIVIGLLFCLLFIMPSHWIIVMMIHASCLGIVSLLFFTLSEISVHYLTPFDYWFIFLYLLIGASFIITTIIAGLNRKGYHIAINRIKRMGMIVFILIIVGYFYYFFIIVLNWID